MEIIKFNGISMIANDQFPKVYLYRRIAAKLFIENNFQENINLADIADEAFFSKFHFMRLFKMSYGKTPHQYLISVRIENAKLLLQTDITVADVCFSVGFDSITSFTGLFKRLTKMTPSSYQKDQLKRKHAMVTTPLRFIPNCFVEKKYGKKQF